MKLDEYVKQTLLDISNGVASAQNTAQHMIAPRIISNVELTTPQMVSFEVAITVSKEAGGGITVFSVGNLKAQGTKEDSHRISFEVPVFFQAPTESNEWYKKSLKIKDE